MGARGSSTSSLEEEILSREWFYEFTLPSGRKTKIYIPEEVHRIHTTRLDMMFSVLDPLIGKDWAKTTCIDFASHEGYYAYHLARKCKQVVGIDFQEDHIRSANLIKQVYGMQNMEFVLANLASFDVSKIQPADVVNVFGLLYHLEDPVGVMRRARRLTKRVMLVETQTTILDLTGRIDSGYHLWSNQIEGIFGICPGALGPGGAATDITLYPSPRGLVWIMNRLGFSRVEVVPPPEGAFEQLATGKRMMVAGYV